MDRGWFRRAVLTVLEDATEPMTTIEVQKAINARASELLPPEMYAGVGTGGTGATLHGAYKAGLIADWFPSDAARKSWDECIHSDEYRMPVEPRRWIIDGRGL